jgi:hypothetical protein
VHIVTTGSSTSDHQFRNSTGKFLTLHVMTNCIDVSASVLLSTSLTRARRHNISFMRSFRAPIPGIPFEHSSIEVDAEVVTIRVDVIASDIIAHGVYGYTERIKRCKRTA